MGINYIIQNQAKKFKELNTGEDTPIGLGDQMARLVTLLYIQYIYIYVYIYIYIKNSMYIYCHRANNIPPNFCCKTSHHPSMQARLLMDANDPNEGIIWRSLELSFHRD